MEKSNKKDGCIGGMMMKVVKRYLRLYRIYCAQFIKTIMQSKLDFFIGLVGFLLSQFAGITFLYLIFQQIPTLQGWTFDELLFVYGFAQIPRGLDHLLTDNIWMVAWWEVVNGNFDRYLIRPMNLFFQVICQKLQPDALGELTVGIVLTVRAIQKGVIELSILNVIVFIISIIAGGLIYTSVKLFFTTFSFWTKISGQFVQTAYNTADFSKYPIGIYPKSVRFVISFLIPFAFVAYIPSTYFLKGASFVSTVGAECLISIVLAVIAYRFFVFGSKRYESAGN